MIFQIVLFILVCYMRHNKRIVQLPDFASTKKTLCVHSSWIFLCLSWILCAVAMSQYGKNQTWGREMSMTLLYCFRSAVASWASSARKAGY